MPKTVPLLPGERPILKAPSIALGNDMQGIPQHYLKYQHSRETIENLVLNIEYHARFPIFVGQQGDQLYLQVGIIGLDNYRSMASQAGMKIVYGRKWRIEPQLPTSEIIQTAFLALQKAREHEVRELFKLNNGIHITTPFNSHHDLPLMASYCKETGPSISVSCHQSLDNLKTWLAQAKFDGARLQLMYAHQRKNGSWILDIEILPVDNSHLPETCQRQITLLLNQLNRNALYFALMDEFLATSNKHVEAFFRFKGFARFSRDVDLSQISELSYATRRADSYGLTPEDFQSVLELTNYQTDLTRVPSLYPGPLTEKIQRDLAQFDIQQGIMPTLEG